MFIIKGVEQYVLFYVFFVLFNRKLLCKFPIKQKALRAGCALARSENAAKMQPRSARECR